MESTREIIGFNDQSKFIVENGQIIVVDNGPLYKNKLKNGLLLDTLCFMEFDNVPTGEILDKVEMNKVICKNNLVAEWDNCDENAQKFQVKKYKKNATNDGKKNNKKRNNKCHEKNRRKKNKRKMLKIGNDYKMVQYHDSGIYFPKIIRSLVIPSRQFECEVPMCNKCLSYAMVTKKYFMLYKSNYNVQFCNHVKCWSCAYVHTFAYRGHAFKCRTCLINDDFIYTKSSHNVNLNGYVGYKRNYPREIDDWQYSFDYNRNYKCDLDFSYYTDIFHNAYLDHRGNTVIQIYDEDIFELKIDIDTPHIFNNYYRDDYSDTDDYDYDD